VFVAGSIGCAGDGYNGYFFILYCNSPLAEEFMVGMACGRIGVWYLLEKAAKRMNESGVREDGV
jgi:hypothetical protein